MHGSFCLVFVGVCFSVCTLMVSGSVYTGDEGPEYWPNLYPECGGSKQSPIDLPGVCNTVARFVLIRNKLYYQQPMSLNVTVSDHSVQIVPMFANDAKIKVEIGLTPISIHPIFILEQIHFHWGTENSFGSEHTLGNKSYAGEAHAVHYNSKYGSFENAQTQPDGLMVIGYLYEVVDNADDYAMDGLTRSFKHLQETKTRTVNTSNFPPISKLLPPLRSNYFTYSGSLTTPPCYQSVKWVVYADILQISEENMKAFRDFYEMEPGLINNFRPTQHLNGRSVTCVVSIFDNKRGRFGKLH